MTLQTEFHFTMQQLASMLIGTSAPSLLKLAHHNLFGTLRGHDWCARQMDIQVGQGCA
jgi:hypothetical protein